MKAVRIGNDVRNILIPVTRFAEPFLDWDSLVDLKVHAVERNRRKYFVTPTTVYKEDGQLRLYFSAEDLQLGIYDILITFSIADPINQDGQQPKIIDIQKAFSIVEHTSQEVDSQDDFTVALDFARDGLSYYQIWSQYFAGTQEDMIAWHRQPSVDAAALANEAAQGAIDATNSLLSNVVSLEIREDMNLYLTTPDVYSGFTFEIQDGNLVAIV